MSKTKTIRAKVEDAFLIEQTSRELAAELQTEITVSMLMEELVKYVPQAKEKIKERANYVSPN
jgi:hypothetical protein